MYESLSKQDKVSRIHVLFGFFAFTHRRVSCRDRLVPLTLRAAVSAGLCVLDLRGQRGRAEIQGPQAVQYRAAELRDVYSGVYRGLCHAWGSSHQRGAVDQGI